MTSSHPSPGVTPSRRCVIGALCAVTVALSGIALVTSSRAGAQSGDYTFEVRTAGRAFSAKLPPNSVATFKWAPGAATGGAWLTTPTSSGTGLTRTLSPSTVSFGATTSAPAA